MNKRKTRDGNSVFYGTFSLAGNSSNNVNHEAPVVNEGRAIDAVVTEEGVQHVARIFDSYPRLAAFARRPSVWWIVGFSTVFVFLIFYLVFRFNIHKREYGGGVVDTDVASTGKREEPPPQWVSPAAVVLVRNFTDDQSGFSSGRKETFLAELVLSTKKLMDTMATPCATPWLETTSRQHVAHTPTVYNNLLMLKGSDTPLFNVNIEWLSDDYALITNLPFNYKDITKTSRVYSEKLVVSHSRGTHTSRSADEAFCIQELY